MPPQPGVFALPYPSTHANDPDMTFGHRLQAHHQSIPGPSGARVHGQGSTEDGRKERKRKEVVGRLGKEMAAGRDDGRHYSENISSLHNTALRLSTQPPSHPLYNIRLYPLSLERSALLAQFAVEERLALDGVQTAYDEERERVEEEWRKGHDKIRERLLEGIEERRRRAREEKEGEGTVNDASLDSQSRPHITRKLRNKYNGSPPPTPLDGLPLPSGLPAIGSNTPLTITNPHSLSIDELPSPFPLPLTSVSLLPMAALSGGGANGAKRRSKAGAGTHASQVGVGGLGKSLAMLGGAKEMEVEADLGEIRRGNKRRRVAAGHGRPG